MNQLNVIALANTFGLIDLTFHLLFRLWIFISPQTYQSAMHLFVAGFQLKVTPEFDLNLINIVVSSLLEASAFWILGAGVALIYNKFSSNEKTTR